MASIIGFFLGIAVGANTARKRGGNWLDMVQYGLVFGLIFGLLAIIGSVVAVRMGWV